MGYFYIMCLIGTAMLAGISQIIIKKIVSDNPLSLDRPGGVLHFFLGVAESPLAYLAVLLTIISVGLWLMALSKVPINTALPFTFFNYVFVAFFAYIFFDESLMPSQIFGTVIMGIGLWLVVSG